MTVAPERGVDFNPLYFVLFRIFEYLQSRYVSSENFTFHPIKSDQYTLKNKKMK